MRQKRITDFSQLHEVISAFGHLVGVGWMFRGQADSTWAVVPKAGRVNYCTGTDLRRFNVWRARACAFSDLPENDWECLAVAQHHGLATRLLDWTMNPLVAAYFAINECQEFDGALYCYMPEDLIDPETATFENVKRVAAYRPRSLVQRIVNQNSIFTYHPDPDRPLAAVPLNSDGDENLVRIIIPATAKHAILKTLDRYGIHEVGLFPDLDGLSRYINWETAGLVNLKQVPPLPLSQR